jgi:hypothetical protein
MWLLIALGIAVAIAVWVATGGHVFFLPLLVVPLGLIGLGRSRQRRGQRL